MYNCRTASYVWGPSLFSSRQSSNTSYLQCLNSVCYSDQTLQHSDRLYNNDDGDDYDGDGDDDDDDYDNEYDGDGRASVVLMTHADCSIDECHDHYDCDHCGSDDQGKYYE